MKTGYDLLALGRMSHWLFRISKTGLLFYYSDLCKGIATTQTQLCYRVLPEENSGGFNSRILNAMTYNFVSLYQTTLRLKSHKFFFCFPFQRLC
jgi:hypothetical protein